jgi:dCMP deaminase
MNRWHDYFFGLCELNASMSKDPSTKVGAVIVRPNKTVAAMGWNGFPRDVTDDEARYADRPTKLAMTVHAEANAILSANEPIRGCTLYVTPLHPCANCAGLIIQSGIVRVVARTPVGTDLSRWEENFRLSREMLVEAGITVNVSA